MRWIFILACLVSPFWQVCEPKSTYEHYRLPRALRPLHYNLVITTHLEDPTNLYYSGEVQIVFQALNATKYIILHAAELLQIPEGRTLVMEYYRGDEPDSRKFFKIKSIHRQQQHDYYIIALAKSLLPDHYYELTLQFGAVLKRKLSGYYVSSYNDEATNATKYLTVTQFEPTDARSAFPCFDEPDLKATFNITLCHMEHFNSISNMPLLERTSIKGHKGWDRSSFEKTVPMSTYLVAFSVNDFQGFTSTAQLSHPVEFSTWARVAALEQCRYAAKVAPRILAFYEQIFLIPYPLPKMDQLAVPDFSAGAMENWGLIVYRESAIFYAQEASSQMDKQRVANIIAHELAHQWFGNLVTMKWWNDLWLNEGFATYIALLGMDKICKNWHAYEAESLDNTLTILNTDGFYSTRPVSQSVSRANQVGDLFDSITYRKGAVIIRMMHIFIGDEAFRSGLKTYLKRHAYGNAEQSDLWLSLTKAARQCGSMSGALQVRKIMDTWTLQAGVPLVTVKRDYVNNTVQLHQRRFLVHGRAQLSDNLTLHSAPNCWFIPLSFATEKLANFSHTAPRNWLQCDGEGMPVPLTIDEVADEDEWIIFNVQVTAPYRVNYDECNWELITAALLSSRFERIHVMNRAQLLDDALALAWSGDIRYKRALELLKYLKQERHFMPWRAALDQLNLIYRIIRQTPQYEQFQNFMLTLLKPIYCQLDGMKVTENTNARGDPHYLQHKLLITQWACRMRQRNCVRHALRYFQEWVSSDSPDASNPIPQDLRSVVYCTAIRQGDANDWNFLWERYKNASVASEKRIILLALGCSREVWLLQRYLKYTFDARSAIRKQDATFAFCAVAREELGSHFAKEFYMNNFEMLVKFFEPNPRDLVSLLVQLSQHLSTPQDYKQLKIFIAWHSDKLQSVSRSIRRVLEQAQLNTRWRTEQLPSFVRGLRGRGC